MRPSEQLCNIDASAATPFSPYPYPIEVGTPITGTSGAYAKQKKLLENSIYTRNDKINSNLPF